MDGPVTPRIPQRVLVVGSGSIAQRHVRNLLAMGVGEVLVLTARDVSDVESFADARVRILPEVPADCPPLAIIANDTHKHAATARGLVARGVHLLMEKPVADGFSAELDALRDEIREAGVVVRVAYNLRFLGVMDKIAQTLRDRTLGQLLFARIEVGQWLPDWRPNRSLAQLYSASSQRGGGVGLDLSHEIDYMLMLFGTPVHHCVRYSRTGVLGIEAADVFDGIYSFDDGFTCTLHMDYLERSRRRRIRIVGSEGVLECDIPGRSFDIIGACGESHATDEALFDTDATYVRELESFFSAVDGVGENDLTTFDEAVEVLAMLSDSRGDASRGREGQARL